MSFKKKIWKDRQSEYPTRRKLISTGTANEYDVTRSEGAVSQQGDAFNAENMNDLENRIATEFEELEKNIENKPTVTSGSWDDLFVENQTVVHTVGAGLTNEPTATTTGYWMAVTIAMENGAGVQLAIRHYTSTPRIYARKRSLSNGFSDWIQFVGAEYDSATNTLNFVM